MITAATVRRSFLDPALEAQAYNDEQRLLLFNPSAEVDSLVEIVRAERARGTSKAHALRLARLARQLVDSNRRERHFKRQIAGAADRAVRARRDLELNGDGEAVLASKAIARALREPLRTLGDAARQDWSTIRALREIDQLLARVPRLQVLSPTVARELGRAKYELLAALADPETRSAQGVTPRAPQDHRGSDGPPTE